MFIHNPGASQTVSVPTLTRFNDKNGPIHPVDDTRWVPPAGPTLKTFMLFTDAPNTTYRVDAPFSMLRSGMCTICPDQAKASDRQVLCKVEQRGSPVPFPQLWSTLSNGYSRSSHSSPRANATMFSSTAASLLLTTQRFARQ